jgi:C_GCAxxG_C_C family probable redox protein
MNDTMIQMMKLGQKGYSCAQILILLALEMRGETNPALVRAMAGLAYGCGGGGGTCGALTGASCVLGLYAGKGDDHEEASEKLLVMMQELSDWFQDNIGGQYGGITCEAVVGQDGPDASRQKCGTMVAETFDKTIEILLSNGFDPSGEILDNIE